MMSEEKRCFVIGPIGAEDSAQRIHADWLFDMIICPCFERRPFVVERADKIAEPGMISAQIINRLESDDLVIADLSFHNANAFYEMAIRHYTAKPIIHMIRKGETIPFDVMPHRAIPFGLSKPSEIVAARADLHSAVDSALANDFDVQNPITHARGFKKVAETASPEQAVLLNELADISRRLSRVEMYEADALDKKFRSRLSPEPIRTRIVSVITNGPLPMDERNFVKHLRQIGASANVISREPPHRIDFNVRATDSDFEKVEAWLAKHNFGYGVSYIDD